jgi:RsiW-degrading membrane proteinase PrsW (M82 family)
VLLVRVALGAAPSLFLMVFFYLKDRYEPEPRAHVARAFAIGAATMVPALFAARALAALVGREWLALGGLPARLFEAWVVAGAVEELTKWAAFRALVYGSRELDEPLDGVIYGVALALGLATVENVLCVERYGLTIGLLRALFAVPAHALFGAAMGFYFGRAKLGRGREQQGAVSAPERARLLALALAVPMIFHGAYDFALVELRGVVLYAVVGALSAGLWVFVLVRVRRAQDDSPFRTMTTEEGLP